MTSSSKSELRRCRPLLGTFVEIKAWGSHGRQVHAAVDSAFAVIDSVQRSMSVHDPASEISAANRSAHRHPVPLTHQTRTVLFMAMEIAEQSDGAFDFTVAPTLARWGILPPHLRRSNAGNWRDVTLRPDGRVSFARPLSIDLGGIAKGYAVDLAVDALLRHGVRSGVVNAGGDLRTFGRRRVAVHLRHPAHPGVLLDSMRISNRAVATSSPCFSGRQWQGRTVSHLVAPGRNRAVTGDISVSVLAGECWLADALTKVVLNAPARAERLLEQHRAEAYILTA